MTSRTPTRALLGPAAVFSVAEAAQLLPWGDARSREWLELRGLIIRHGSVPGPCVVWGQVVEALTRPVEAPVAVKLRRSGLL